MPAELESWKRQHYAEGGGEPFLFYVVYGNVQTSEPLSRGKYRTNGPPEGIEMMSYSSDDGTGVPDQFREGYLWNELKDEDPELTERIAQSDQCLVLRGTPAEDSSLDYLRDTVGLITYLLDQGGLAIYDPLMFRWWGAEEWKTRIFEPAAAVPRHHVVILVSEEDDTSLNWFHTRGMQKFGRPDISVHNVPAELNEVVIDLCHRLIEHQAFGQVIPEGHEIRMKELPPGGVLRHGGDLDDPDFNNVHIEAVWPEPETLSNWVQ